ncbi:MAG: hypothetical protein AAFX62_16600 [Pseudomonadota bacterium]
MKDLSTVVQIGLALIASVGFSGSTWAFKTALDTGDQRWMIGAMALLIVSYVPFLTLLGHSMSGTIVITSMMSQVLGLSIAFAVYGEPITLTRACGLTAALIAIVAFALPAAAKG